MTRAAAVVLVAACGGAPAPSVATHAPAAVTPSIVSPTHVGLHRVVTYHYSQDATYDSRPDMDDHSTGQLCSSVVLDEEVTRASGHQELEVVAKIVGGDRPACGVGQTVTITAPTRGTGQADIHADAALDAWTRDRIRDLHAHLGEENGTFTLGGRAMPWHGEATTAPSGYIDLRHDESRESHGMSDSTDTVTLTLRLRERDHAVACATAHDEVRGAGEYGGFHGGSWASIAVDYGDGAPACLPP